MNLFNFAWEKLSVLALTAWYTIEKNDSRYLTSKIKAGLFRSPLISVIASYRDFQLLLFLFFFSLTISRLNLRQSVVQSAIDRYQDESSDPKGEILNSLRRCPFLWK